LRVVVERKNNIEQHGNVRITTRYVTDDRFEIAGSFLGPD